MTENTPKPSRQEREAQRRRHDIIEAATRLFMAHGFQGTTMQMIAEEAEYSVGYLYQHFDGKRDLLDIIVDRKLEMFEAARQEARTAALGRPLEALCRALASASCQLREHASLVPLFLDYQKTCPEKIIPRLVQYRREDAQLIREAMAAGELRICDPDLTAAAIDGMFNGLVKLMAESGHLDRLTEIPGIVETLLLTPLTRNLDNDERKDPALS